MRSSMNLINRDNFDVEKMRKRLLKMKLKLQPWYFIHKLKADKTERPELFRLNGITIEEKLEKHSVQ